MQSNQGMHERVTGAGLYGQHQGINPWILHTVMQGNTPPVNSVLQVFAKIFSDLLLFFCFFFIVLREQKRHC